MFAGSADVRSRDNDSPNPRPMNKQAGETKKKNWRTTLGGVLAVLGQTLSLNEHSPVLSAIGQILQAVGTLILAKAAADA